MPHAIRSFPVCIALWAAVCCAAPLPAQEPAPPSQEPAPVAGPDEVTLDVGTVLNGRIVRETAGYLEIEIAPGTVVGFAKDRTVRIVRGEPDAGPPAPATAFEPTEQWFVVHDAGGEAVGWLHETRSIDIDPAGLRIGQEWSFHGDGEVTELTVLEELAPDGAPRRCFAHERVRRDGEPRVLRERIVRARLIGGGRRLRVERITSNEARTQTEHAAPSGLRFPLELAAELRERPAGQQARETHLVFDPITGEFVRRTFDVGGSRQVEVAGRTQRVRIIEAHGPRGRVAEWLDGTDRAVRRELRGNALVAVPRSESEARRTAGRGEPVAANTVRADATGSMALRVPNPAWTFVELDEEQAAGRVLAKAPLDNARFALLRFDQIGTELLADSALDAVLRWLTLQHDDAAVSEREVRTVRGREAAGARLTWTERDAADRVIDCIAVVHVLRSGPTWFVTAGISPRDRARVVEDDFAWMLSRIELHPDGFAPKATGPLAPR